MKCLVNYMMQFELYPEGNKSPTKDFKYEKTGDLESSGCCVRREVCVYCQGMNRDRGYNGYDVVQERDEQSPAGRQFSCFFLFGKREMAWEQIAVTAMW